MMTMMLMLGSLALCQHEPSHLTGGFKGKEVTGVAALTPEERDIDSFVRREDPLVEGWKVVHIRTQVVAGVRYCLTYISDKGDLT